MTNEDCIFLSTLLLASFIVCFSSPNFFSLYSLWHGKEEGKDEGDTSRDGKRRWKGRRVMEEGGTLGEGIMEGREANLGGNEDKREKRCGFLHNGHPSLNLSTELKFLSQA